MSSVRLRVLAAAFAAGVAISAGTGRAGEPATTRYAYDPAGRLIEARRDDGPGRAVREAFVYDAAGNLLARRTSRGRDFAVAVQKPRAGVWLVTVWDDGPVTGFGADTSGGLFEVAGSLTFDAKFATGTLALADEVTGVVSSSLVVAKSKLKRTKSGELRTVALRSPKAGSPALLAQGTALGAAPSGFAGTYGSSANRVTLGTKKKKLGAVVFTAIPFRPGASTVSGAVTGTLVRDAAGTAFGTVTYDGVAHAVRSVLKNRAANLTLRSTKGPKFELTLRR